MDPDTLLRQGVIPAMLVCFLALAGLLQRRALPAVFAGLAYLAGYVVLIGIPAFAAKGPRTPEVWEAMLPAALVATVAGVLIELLPLRWTLRLPAFVIAAVICTWVVLPAPAKLEGAYGLYFVLTAGASIAAFAALRLPDRRYPAPLSPLVLCLTCFAAGFLIAWFWNNGKQGQPGLILSVPLGAMAAFTLFRPLRDIAAAAVTPATLILPGIVALATYYVDPSAIVPGRMIWIVLLLALSSLAALIALLPAVRARAWLATVAAAVLTLLLLGGGLGLAAVSVVAAEY